ncbi:Lrp/AsnC family transcriptional regulator [Candidatus Woesearchaeota archaeon]|nr:Lrp/AsnC family transcriptional regulator [Candidatus Woesearchaeota archaeon]MBT6518565.1 Lrp/AsnC family transcriptional regulator [Candidatus Woesearchaeota archaeon]MBT7366907.1 Lrp/AsnC family transcriptional regulator [Candidatus Woesearchaeota archaeon]
MISNKDKLIIGHLRSNARVKITDLSKLVNIPVTTLYSKLKNYDRKLIKKHTCLLDYSKLGFHKNVFFVLKSTGDRDQLQDFLNTEFCVNSLFRVNFGYDFLVDCIFRDEKEVSDFMDGLVQNHSAEIQMLNIIDEIKREEFLKHTEEDLKND